MQPDQNAPVITLLTGGACQARYPCGHTAMFSAQEPIALRCPRCQPEPGNVTYAHAGLPSVS